MYALLRVMQVLAIIAVIFAVMAGALNRWQKKHDPKNAIYSKEYSKMVKTVGILSVGLLLVSGIMLDLKMY